jgi:DNA-binding LytR/AlgR family response regulator
MPFVQTTKHSHRSALVKLSRVRAIHGDADSAEIEMEDRQRAAASRRRLAELKRRIGVA